MNAGLLGRGLLLVALALVGGLVLPARTRAAAIRGEAALARAQARRLLSQQRTRPRTEPVAALPAGASPSERVRLVRRALLEALDGRGLRDLRIEVHDAPQAPAGVDVKVAATGRFVELVEATSRLLVEERGLTLTSVRLAPTLEDARLELEGRCR